MLDIHLFGTLRRFAQESSPTAKSVIQLPWVEGETISGLAERIGFGLDELGEVFVNHKPVTEDTIIPQDARVGLFSKGMFLLCGGQHMKGHGFITRHTGNNEAYWTK